MPPLPSARRAERKSPIARGAARERLFYRTAGKCHVPRALRYAWSVQPCWKLYTRTQNSAIRRSLSRLDRASEHTSTIVVAAFILLQLAAASARPLLCG